MPLHSYCKYRFDATTQLLYPDRVKRGYGVKYTFRLIKRHIRVLPDRVKRGYGVKYTFRLIKRHIRVLPDRVKRGYGEKY